MTTLLLLISFILNIISIFAVIILYLRQNRLVQVEQRQVKNMKELEELISTYMMEMKEENEEFIQKLILQKEKLSKKPQNIDSSKELDHEKEKKSSNQMIDKSKEKNKIVKQQGKTEIDRKSEQPPHLEKTMAYQAVRAYKQQNVSPQTEKDLLASELDLKNRFSNEEIIVEIDKQTELSQEQTVQEEKEITENLYMKSLYNQTLLLKKQGFNEEDIARKLNKGKTEIELLLKLYQMK
ncbi:hypothetical protein [Bacillus massilinigeriensis]|uniref:hypothetical protein n=1 Tax=Bacillus massilionigeriensis TaxID=1805475 RepID=UPI00096B047C|nr:hypothetical protein [Bacillus massilionigeriensis]